MKPKFSTRAIVAISFIVLLFLILNFTGFDKFVKNFFYKISAPINETLWQAGDSLSGFFDSFLEAKNLKGEAEELRLENIGLLAEIGVLKELARENETLREALAIGLEKEYQLEIAQVIGKDISQDSILINKGKEDGVLEDMPIITEQKVLLGRVGEVYDNFSEVILISHQDSSFDAKLLGEEIYGLVKGMGSFQQVLDLIPKEEVVKEGDLVVTAALGNIFPRGILVGTVKEVKNSDLDPFQRAVLKPGFTIKSLNYIFIITDF